MIVARFVCSYSRIEAKKPKSIVHRGMIVRALYPTISKTLSYTTTDSGKLGIPSALPYINRKSAD